MSTKPRQEFLGPITRLAANEDNGTWVSDGTGVVDGYGSVIKDVSIVMKGLTTHPTTGTHKGSFWVNDNTSPTLPYFTDSAGNDVQLGSGGGGSIGNLSTVRFCDPSTSIPLIDQIGTIAAPFSNLQTAINDCPDGGTVYITPFQSYASTLTCAKSLVSIVPIIANGSVVAKNTGAYQPECTLILNTITINSGCSLRIESAVIDTVNLDSGSSLFLTCGQITTVNGGDGTAGKLVLHNCYVWGGDSLPQPLIAEVLLASNTRFVNSEITLRNNTLEVGNFSLESCTFASTSIEFVNADGYLLVDNITDKAMNASLMTITNGQAIPDGAPLVYPAHLNSNNITGSGGSQVGGSFVLPTIDNIMLIVGCRCWYYENANFENYGYADFQVLCRRSAGTWTILSGTETPLLNTIGGSIVSAISADINSGALRILITPGSNNGKSKIEFWKSTEMLQD